MNGILQNILLALVVEEDSSFEMGLTMFCVHYAPSCYFGRIQRIESGSQKVSIYIVPMQVSV